MSHPVRTANAPLPWARHPGVIALLVVGLHALGLWALQAGMLRRAAEAVVPAEILVEIWSPPPESAPAAPPVAPSAARRPSTVPPVNTTPEGPPATPPAAPPSLLPPPAVATAPAQNSAMPVATTSIATSAVNTGAKAQNSLETGTANSAIPAPPRIELPSSDADYLHNPKPPYPALSKRLGEQGKVVVRTLIGTDGRAQEVQLQQSSGFERLDQAALTAARQWRYVPGKRDGVPQAMWFNVPITFQLQ